MTCLHDHSTSDTAVLHSRRGIVTGLGAAAVLAAARTVAAADASAEDEEFMRLALAEARQADFPFGAVIVRDGEVIARGRNLGRTNGDPTAHGEMVAIRRCLADHGSAALKGATIYTSGEPCVMCIGRDRLVPLRPPGLCRLGRADRDQDQSDHDPERRGRRQRIFRADQDHRRRSG
jgi:cytidine deaminase